MPDTRSRADKEQATRIRAWARAHDWPQLGDTGRIPAAVRRAWEARDPAEDLEQYDDVDPPDPDGDRGGEPDWQWAPASLEEARERGGLDPDAAHLRGRGRRGAEQGRDEDAPIRITRAVQRDITGKMAFWLSIPAEPWLRVDPYCGKAYADQVDQIALKVTPLICQSPAMVRWLSKSSTFILWTEFLMACRPVAEAHIAHHITKRVTLDSNGGVVEQAGAGVDFSAYTSRRPNPAAAA
jgi:hypothetical protein